MQQYFFAEILKLLFSEDSANHPEEGWLFRRISASPMFPSPPFANSPRISYLSP
jgi:hypothetical protein